VHVLAIVGIVKVGAVLARVHFKTARELLGEIGFEAEGGAPGNRGAENVLGIARPENIGAFLGINEIRALVAVAGNGRIA